MDLQAIQVNVRYILPLQALTRADVSRVGAKAANRGELVQAGFLVPDGFAVTTEAFDHFVQLNRLEGSQTPE